jgi:hypothetical protein
MSKLPKCPWLNCSFRELLELGDRGREKKESNLGYLKQRCGLKKTPHAGTLSVKEIARDRVS